MPATFLTYNIHGGVGRDNKRDLHRIAEVINEVQADVVALQEVDSRPGDFSASEQMSLLSRLTNMSPIPGPTIIERDRSYGNLLLTRVEYQALPPINISFHNREPRNAIQARVFIDNHWLTVIATHFGLSIKERRFQAQTLAKTLASIDEPVVVMGDLNDWMPLIDIGIQPLRKEMPRQKRQATFPSNLPLFALDRIWSRPADLLTKLSVYKSPSAVIASDHLPLVGEINLKND